MPWDFGFIAEWGVARTNMNAMDTFAGTFTKDLVTGCPITASTELRLSADEMTELYQELLAIDILGHPSDFAPPYADATRLVQPPDGPRQEQTRVQGDAPKST